MKICTKESEGINAVQACWLRVRRAAWASSSVEKGTGALVNDVGWRLITGSAGADDDMDEIANALQVCNRNNKGPNLQGV